MKSPINKVLEAELETYKPGNNRANLSKAFAAMASQFTSYYTDAGYKYCTSTARKGY